MNLVSQKQRVDTITMTHVLKVNLKGILAHIGCLLIIKRKGIYEPN